VLKNVIKDRHGLLENCNRATRNNSAYPVFLHDAEAGWDILTQQQFPVEHVIANPGFMRANVENLPIAASRTRQTLLQNGVTGSVHSWSTGEDLRSLLIRSMM
jgi:hypothetical protein